MKPLKELPRIGLAAVLAICVTGCLKRKEQITVHPDGRVSMHLEYEAESLGELEQGDAMPSEQAGWTVEHLIEVKDDGKEEHTLIADREFPPGAPLPQNFAAPQDPDTELYLQFPTELTQERRPDGTYFHFRRVFTPRPWAQIDALHQEIREHYKNELETVEEKKPEKMTHEDRVLLVKVAVAREEIKMQAFARWAWQDVAPNAPQDTWLAIHEALELHAQSIDADRMAGLIAAAQHEENNEALEAEASAFELDGRIRMIDAWTDRTGATPRDIDAFTARVDWYKKQYEITEDLGDESYEITVIMPGEIVAANADRVDGNEAYWEFDADLFRDRDVEIMVTSRIAN